MEYDWERDCDTCEFDRLSAYETPCDNCNSGEKWVIHRGFKTAMLNNAPELDSCFEEITLLKQEIEILRSEIQRLKDTIYGNQCSKKGN